MRSSAIQEQLDDLITSLKDAEARQRAAAAAVADNPSDLKVRNRLRELIAQAREICEEKNVLEVALAEARKHESSDGERQKRARARNLVKESINASHARVKKAAAVDKAIAQLGVAMRELIETCDKSVSTAMEFLAMAHRGDMMRRMDHALVFRSEARGDAYTTPAIGRALGYALHGIDLPNIPLRDWLHVNEGPCSPTAVEEAAALCVERYAPRIAHHLETHIGLEEPSNEQNA